MSEPRHVRLFRNGRNQAVRTPVEFELPGDEAVMYRDGNRLVIGPVRKRGLVALLQRHEAGGRGNFRNGRSCALTHSTCGMQPAAAVSVDSVTPNSIDITAPT